VTKIAGSGAGSRSVPKCHGSATLLYPMGHFSAVSWWAWLERWGRESRLCWRRCSGSWRRPAAALPWTGCRKVRALSAAGSGFPSQAVGIVLDADSQSESGSRQAEIAPQKKNYKKKFSCQYSGLNDLQVLFGLHPSAAHVCSCNVTKCTWGSHVAGSCVDVLNS
jgi:hypothetical protein